MTTRANTKKTMAQVKQEQVASQDTQALQAKQELEEQSSDELLKLCSPELQELLRDLPDISLPVKKQTSLSGKRMDEVEYVPREWLLQDELPFELTLFSGEPGIGKTTLTAYLAAAVAGGWSWYDGIKRFKQGNVLVYNPEETESSFLEKLLALQCQDLEKIMFCHETEGSKEKGSVKVSGPQAVQFPRDLHMIAQDIESLGNVALVIIDPITLAFDKHYNNQFVSKSIIAPLILICRKYGVCIFLVNHLTKEGKNVSGAAALTRHVKVAFTGTMTDNESVAVVQTKNNYAKQRKDPIYYRLLNMGHGTVVHWLTEEEILAATNSVALPNHKLMQTIALMIYHNEKPMSAQAISQQLTTHMIEYSNVHMLIGRMCEHNVLYKVGYGVYDLLPEIRIAFDNRLQKTGKPAIAAPSQAGNTLTVTIP